MGCVVCVCVCVCVDVCVCVRVCGVVCGCVHAETGWLVSWNVVEDAVECGVLCGRLSMFRIQYTLEVFSGDFKCESVWALNIQLSNCVHPGGILPQVLVAKPSPGLSSMDAGVCGE